MSVNTVKQDGSLQRIAGGLLYADAPVGTISPFGGSVIPNGYLLCNGQAVSRTDYAELFAVIGIAYGIGDGSTSFNLPDLRETVPVGAGRMTGRDVGAHDVYTVGGFKDDQLQGHWHGDGTTSVCNVESRVDKGFINILDNEWANKTTDFTKNTISDDIHGTARIGDTTHGKQLGVNYIIKAKQVAVPFDMAEYIRNQNILSDYEDITLPTTATTAITMPYDGVYILANYGVSNIHHIYLNGIEISAGITGNSTTGASTSSTILFKKGDTMYRLNTYTDSTFVEHVAYYKLRDYTGR